MQNTELFPQKLYLKTISDLFSNYILMNANEINSKLETFSKKFPIDLKITNDLNHSGQNFSLFETNIFERELNCDGEKRKLRMTLSENVPIDVESFLSEVCNLIEKKIFVPFKDSDTDDFNEFGVWVLDAIGNVLYKNKNGHDFLTRNKKVLELYKPEIICLGDSFYLVIPDIDFKRNVFFHYSFKISDEILSRCTQNTVKELSLEASMLAHELRNPLTGIKFGAELLKMNCSVPNTPDEILKSVNKCNEIIKIFLEFYKNDQKTTGGLNNLNSFFERVHEILGVRGENIEIDIKGDIPILKNRNDSLMLITFYIFLNNLISFCARQDLIERKNSQCILLSIEGISDNLIIISGRELSLFLKRLESRSGQFLFMKSLFNLNKIFLEFRNSDLILEFG